MPSPALSPLPCVMNSSLEGLEIGGYRESELPAIVDYYGPGDSPVDPFADLARLRFYVRHGRLLVARVRGKLAGFIFYRISDSPWYDESGGRAAVIDELHVLPKYRRRGIATILLKRSLDEIRLKNIKRVYIESATVPSLRLYKRSGFSLIRIAYFLRRDL